MRFFTSLLLLAGSLTISAQSHIADVYIEQYHNIAISEMHRTGIPASIKLAQGLLESNWGRSTLAVESNNHFGIKCSGNYSGKSHYRYDDDYDKNGKKKKSCFRVYDYAEASYIDHSDFLTDPKKSKRYGFLFEYAKEDYQSWAKGLSKAGYATDPKYPGKLINIIEKYDLHQYDLSDQYPEMIAAVEAAGNSRIESSQNYRINYINSCKVVLAKGGENLKDISSIIGVSSRKLIKYNSEIDSRKTPLHRGQKIFLEPKRNYYLGDESIHIINAGENLAEIANEYGINADYLSRINDVNIYESLAVGESIKLKRNATAQYAMREEKPKPVNIRSNRNKNRDNSRYLFDEALTPVKN